MPDWSAARFGSSDDLLGTRLLALRELRQWTQGEAAELLDVSSSHVSRVEKSALPLTIDLAQRAAIHGRVPVSFFAVGPHPADFGEFTFRKTSKASVRDEKQVARMHTELARLFHETSKASGYHPFVPQRYVTTLDDPEAAAMELRAGAGVAESARIPNMVRFLERMGIGVATHLSEREVHPAHHGISRPTRQNERPLVGTIDIARGDALRMTLAHELAHLIFDADAPTAALGVRSPRERRAFRFGGALLVPAPVMRQRISERSPLSDYVHLKADYGISIAAAVHRARDLELITDARYRSLSIQLSTRGWRNQEPVEIPPERPLLLQQALLKVFAKNPLRTAVDTYGLDFELVERNVGPLESRGDGDLAPIISLHERR